MIHETIWLASLTDSERRELNAQPPGGLPETTDLLVVGGGIVGVAIAYFLCKRRAGRVLLVEKGPLASGAHDQGHRVPPERQKQGYPELCELYTKGTRLRTDSMP